MAKSSTTIKQVQTSPTKQGKFGVSKVKFSTADFSKLDTSLTKEKKLNYFGRPRCLVAYLKCNHVISHYWTLTQLQTSIILKTVSRFLWAALPGVYIVAVFTLKMD